MTLLHYVAATLARAGVRHAVIGAAAMAIRGVGRSTHDIDLLTLSRACLDASWWTTPAGVDVAVRRGDAHDPLAGVVRVEQAGRRPVDLVVGRHRWQTRILERAESAVVAGTRVPVVQARDLVLLKLFAGGAQDGWDIAQLLAGPDRASITAGVGADLDDLPVRCRRLWNRIVDTALDDDDDQIRSADRQD